MYPVFNSASSNRKGSYASPWSVLNWKWKKKITSAFPVGARGRGVIVWDGRLIRNLIRSLARCIARTNKKNKAILFANPARFAPGLTPGNSEKRIFFTLFGPPPPLQPSQPPPPHRSFTAMLVPSTLPYSVIFRFLDEFYKSTDGDSQGMKPTSQLKHSE